MNILITGNQSIIARSLAGFLLDRNHYVIFTVAGEGFKDEKRKNLTEYHIRSGDTLYPEVFRAHAFDLVIFVATDESGFLADDDSMDPVYQNHLAEILELSSKTGVEDFVLVSSTRIYGKDQSGHENEEPRPDTAFGQILLNNENLCLFYGKERKLRVTIIRVPFVYGPKEYDSFLLKTIQIAASEKKVEIQASPQSVCQFLHINDLMRFIHLLLDHDSRQSGRIYNLSSENVNLSFIDELLNFHFPKFGFIFRTTQRKSEEPAQKISVLNANKDIKWFPKHKLVDEIHFLIEETTTARKMRKPPFQFFRSLGQLLKPALGWLEVILGAFLMHLVTIWTETIIEFKFIDYRLLYVVLIGSTHGLLLGVLASLLAMISAAFRWMSIGLDWALLVYNVENWIPFALYFLAGSVTGYAHDKYNNEIAFEKNQTKLIHDKYEFLFNLYSEISKIKDRLRGQLVGYRDSFGRFFKVASELNELEEDNIFLKALEVLEDLLKTDQIAIYTVESTGKYGRLEVKSSNLKKAIPKSILLSDFSLSLDQLKNGGVFQNKDLLANYPAYIAPIINQGNLIGLIILWDVKFEQFTLYYSNLFKVITGLIQSALVRAAMFKNAQIDEIYLPSTKIMRPEFFKQAHERKKKIRRNRIADFQILRVEKNSLDWSEIYRRLSKGIRDDDAVGLRHENDNHCYVILANAGVENIEFIIRRLSELDLNCSYVEELVYE